MGMLKEFKEFAMKGNLVDIAVGFVMGAAFSKVTTAFINGIVMPPIGMIQGKDMSDWKYVIKEAKIDSTGNEITSEVAIQYGTFITTAIEFIIIAFVMFMVIKFINSMKRKEEVAPTPAAQPKSEVLLEEIRDLLKK
ncbi:MAG TPA: large-conductance mechanosensitive channel protein MscL [Chitinophagales bacterium]|nr:large-conductance mechanosensitive channel protein MscL [Chitinophagales bacterium]